MTEPPSNSRVVELDPSAGGMPLPRLLFALLRQRFTGTLELEQPGSWGPTSGVRTVWLRGGMPVFTDWASEGDTLGELLLARGIIDPPMLERGLQALAGGHGRLGEILLGLGAIDATQRSDALRVQCTRKLFHMFALRGGEVRVTARASDGQGDELTPINVLGLILRGVVGHYDRARVELEMGDALAGDLVATPALPKYQRQFGFAEDDGRVLAALARGVTMPGLVKPGVDATRALQLVYVLWTCQMLRAGQDAVEAIAKGATAAAGASEPATPPPTSAKKVEAAKPEAAPPKPAPPKPAPPKPEPPKPEPPKPEPPKPEPPSESGVDFEGQLGMLEAKVAAEANAFELFGLGHEADRKQIREAWAELSKRFHPDALEAHARGHLRSRVEPLFAALSEAYGVLSDKDQREKLREAILAGGSKVKASDDASIVVRNAIEAEMLARDADKLLRGGSWEKARDIYVRAHELSPSDPDIEAALIYARHMAGSRDAVSARVAITALAQVIQLAPGCSRAFYFAGMIHLQLDESEAAKQRFTDALKADPRNVDAERQLRGLKIKERAGAPAPSSSEAKKPDDKKLGGLRGLFGGGGKK
jgi:tetratricopeptide (TPR) repeat protein